MGAAMSDMQMIIAQNIQKFGWHSQCVFGDENWPDFSYSIGWSLKRSWPELLVVGQRSEVAHGMLRRFWDAREIPVPDAERTDILDGFSCRLMEVDLSWYGFLFGAAIDYYMNNNLPPFRVLQCVWPTTGGAMPWDADAPEGFDIAQPLTNVIMDSEPGS